MIEAAQASAARTVPLRAVAVVVAGAVLAGVAAGAVLHRLHTVASPVVLVLPELHGQAVWPAGERAAPLFALHDQRDGAVISLRALRGRPVLLTFLGSRCGGCGPEARRVASVLRRLPRAERPTLVIVSADAGGDTPAAVARAVRHWGLDGAWQWHWLTGSPAALAAVWRGYGVTSGSGQRLRIFLIDRRGDERTAYLFPFLPAFVKGDLARLAKGRA